MHLWTFNKKSEKNQFLDQLRKKGCINEKIYSKNSVQKKLIFLIDFVSPNVPRYEIFSDEIFAKDFQKFQKK